MSRPSLLDRVAWAITSASPRCRARTVFPCLPDRDWLIGDGPQIRRCYCLLQAEAVMRELHVIIQASGEGSGAGGSPMPPRPAQTDGRLDESTSGELARGTDSLRRPQLQTFDANDIGFKLEMSIQTAKELYEIEKNTRSAHRTARDIIFD